MRYNTARSEVLDGQDVWRFDVRRLFTELERGLGRVYVHQSDFLPIKSMMKDVSFGTRHATFDSEGIEIQIESTAGETQTMHARPEGAVYDNEQVIYLLRGLPLSKGYQTTFDFLPLGEPMEMGAEVVDLENVKVPAGKFEAFQVDLSIQQKVWISNDEQRYPVKLKFGGVIAKLKNIGRAQDNEPAVFENEELGFSLTAPAGWGFYAYDLAHFGGVVALEVLDLDADLQARVQVQKRRAIDPKKVLKVAQRDIDILKGAIEAYTVRDSSWREHQVGEWPAASFVAEYRDQGGHPVVDLRTYVLSEKNITLFSFLIEPDQVAVQQSTINDIIDTLRTE